MAKKKETVTPEIEQVTDVDINDVISDNMSEYSKYVIASRAIPDVRDSLIPVRRRILLGMKEQKADSKHSYQKSAKSVGYIMGNYHPHGDSAIYGALANMAKPWYMRLPYIDFQGNAGSIDGDREASSRYTEARLQPFVDEVMLDGLNKKGLVETQPTYDDKGIEPMTLPVKVPTALLNGIMGIGYGYATNIPSFNLREVVDATVYLLQNKDKIDDDELLNIVKGPDFPTGGVISDGKAIRQVVLTGAGSIPNRASYTIEKEKRINRIIFDNIPYDVSKLKIVEELKMLIIDNKVAGLKRAEDESDHEGLRIVVETDSSYDTETLLNALFKETSLEVNFSANMTFVHNKKPRVMGVRDILLAFIHYRMLTKTRELEYDKNVLEARLHLIEGFLRVIDVIDEVIQTIKASKGKQDAQAKLVKQFDFSERQSEAIVSMPLHRLSRTDKQALTKEEKEKLREVKRITAILKSDKKLRDAIVEELEAVKEKYGTPRLTKIYQRRESRDVSEADLVEDTNVHVAVSRNGYIKRSSTRSFGSTDKVGLQEEDEVILETQCSTKDILFIFTSNGQYYRLPVFAIDEYRWGDIGKHIGLFGQFTSSDKVVNAFIVDEKDAESSKMSVLTVKSDGLTKRSSLKHHVVSRYNNSYDAIKIEGDELVLGAWLIDEKASGYLGVSLGEKDKALLFPVSEVSLKGLKVAGMRSINNKEQPVVFAQWYATETDSSFKLGKRGQVGQKMRVK